jgi:hypothetical protein
MADKNIEIGIKTTGAQKSAADIGKVGDALGDIGKSAPRAAGQIDQVADATRQMGTRGQGNAGTAVLEASRAFEDMQYGIRGVLNNIPSLIFALGGSAGLAGVISVAAVAGSALWTKFSSGSQQAKKETEGYLETFKQLVEVYTELDKNSAEDRAKAAEQVATNLKNSLAGINTRVSAQTDAGSLEAARERAAAQLQLAEDRLRVAQLEQRIALSTGVVSLRLAQEREAVIRRIYDTELKISEVARKQAMAAAQAKTAGAGETLGQVAADAQGKASALATKEAEQARLTDELYKLTTDRVRLLEETKAKIVRENELLYQMALETGNAELAAEVKRRQPGELDRAQEKLGQPSFREQELAAQAAAMDGPISELAAQAKTAADAQQAAARAMEEASRALLQLRETQSVERDGEAGIKAAEAIGQVGQDVTQAAKDAIAAIAANASSQGRALNPAEQEAIGRAQQLVADTTPDAQQGSQLASILQSLSNNLTAKDQVLSSGIDRIINTTKNLATKYQGLADKIKDLESRVNQIK